MTVTPATPDPVPTALDDDRDFPAHARPFAQVDVSSTTPHLGNPVAVVLDGSAGDDEQMQLVARRTDLSETMPVLPPTDPAADSQLRIWTPGGAPSAPVLLTTLVRCSAVTLHSTDRSSSVCRWLAVAGANSSSRTDRFLVPELLPER